MQKFKIALLGLLLISTQLSARSDLNPFAKSIENTFGTSVAWQYTDNAAIKTAQDVHDASTYYHLKFDGKSLQLILSGDNTNSPASAKHFEQFAVEDVLIDGKRVPLFEWCLTHQQRHDRFLQQGLTVEKNICENQGDKGAFVMMLNQDTLDQLEAGKTLSFVIKPFRTSIVINYALADFSSMVARLVSSHAPAKAVAKAPEPAAKSVVTICKVKPPVGFETIKAVEYPCGSVVDEVEANKTMLALVGSHRKKVDDEKESKRQAELATKKKTEDERMQLELKQKREAAVIAASKLKQQELTSDITAKMLAVCHKMWDKGEHRCYCEKYIDQAPEAIKALSCAK
jgi:hypothetical protein